MTKQLKLDAGQSPTLARPDAPLATGVTKISSVDKNNKKRLPWLRRLRNRKTNFISIIHSLNFAKFYQPWKLAEIGHVNFVIIGLTGIVKNK